MAAFTPDYFDREAAPGVLGGFAVLMCFEAAGEICGDAGVEGVVRAEQDVDVPVIH